eukprot:377141-Rhodomonas_salina.3
MPALCRYRATLICLALWFRHCAQNALTPPDSAYYTLTHVNALENIADGTRREGGTLPAGGHGWGRQLYAEVYGIATRTRNIPSARRGRARCGRQQTKESGPWADGRAIRPESGKEETRGAGRAA